jgi:hypothetical protein
MTSLVTLSTRPSDDKRDGARSLGTLSLHLDGAPCRVGCAFCYLGARRADANGPAAPDLALLIDALARLRYDEVAVAVSEPLAPALPLVTAIVAAARAPVAITTTLQLARQAPALFDGGVARANLSVDPAKGAVDVARIAATAQALKARQPQLEIVLITSLTTPEFAAQLVDEGLLAALVDAPSVDKVALNALKPPPDWCDRAFWLRTLAKLQPLLARALDSRLFLDCWVAARLLGLGGCPARADLSPTTGGVAFRGCVYSAAPDFVAGDAATLAARLERFIAPAVCPFPIR